MSPEILHGLLYWLPAFLVSTTFHEAAHAWTALRGGDPTAYHGGQASLWPWPHMKREPIGMIVVPLLTTLTQGWTMGWASAPYDTRWALAHPRRAAVMAAAGPLANLALALASFGAIELGLSAGVFALPERMSGDALVAWAGPATAIGPIAASALSVMVALNLLLFAFNLLPLPPLDGASAITLALPDTLARAWRGLMQAGAVRLLGLLVAWRVFPYVAGPLFQALFHALRAGRG